MGTTRYRQILHCDFCEAPQMPPCICEFQKSWTNWWYIRVLPTSHKNVIYVFCWSRLSGWCRFNGGANTPQSWGTICTHWWNPVDIPKTTCNPVSSLPGQTWVTSKVGTYITSTNFRGEAPPRVDTPAPPKVARRITAPYPKMVKLKTPTPTMPYDCTTRYRDRGKTISIIPQEEINILSILKQKELTHLFSGLGVTEGQYMF